ncbi:MAG TPA: hypothetical protein PLP17_03335 [Oligoflexia bacterium]|nr:hypothetical protein [Oligoflexia bacterium]
MTTQVRPSGDVVLAISRAGSTKEQYLTKARELLGDPLPAGMEELIGYWCQEIAWDQLSAEAAELESDRVHAQTKGSHAGCFD